ncbi:hypothetical protein [Apibacter muscae]|uniref:hypothetical protein n=1 Tax=Apibacter muscae TaxID=2509004 RepID=UPI001627ADF0|nr:hypothetical protein [Apibacter muscae]
MAKFKILSLFLSAWFILVSCSYTKDKKIYIFGTYEFKEKEKEKELKLSLEEAT